MTERGKRQLYAGFFLLAVFALWTVLIRCVDVQLAGETGAEIGFATLNRWFHGLTGVHLWIYTLTDWLGLIPVFICLLFGAVGVVQWVGRRGLRKVDMDILLLGGYYIFVMFCYLVFEMRPINYRPILIEGRMEASYPSSTTLLVLSVIPTLILQMRRRMKPGGVRRAILWAAMFFAGFTVVGRLLSGVHWLTDIVGAVLLSAGLFSLYSGVVLLWCGKPNEGECCGGVP